MKIGSLLIILFLLLPSKITAKEAVTLPLNLGIGPALNYIPYVISDDQTFHYALKLDIYALLDRNFLESYKSRAPKKYRRFLEGRDELRVSSIFIPELLIISPAFKHTGIYGVNFRPITLGFPLFMFRSFRSKLGLGLNISYMFIYSDSLFEEKGYMNFLRPGLNIQLDSITKVTKKFLISYGVDTYFYIPQEIRRNSAILHTGDLNRSLWFVAQIYLIFNLRVPYKTKI